MSYKGKDPYFDMSGIFHRLLKVPIESLTGIWRGTASGGSEGNGPSIRDVTLEIGTLCEGAIVACIKDLEVGESFRLNSGETIGGFCFTSLVTSINIRCIYPREDGKLDYTGSGGLWGEDGVLHK
jgi:hypothetical protein